MATGTELIAFVRREIGESSAGRWSDADILANINAVSHKFSLDAGVLRSYDQSITSTAGTFVHDLPDGIPGPSAIIAVFYDDDLLQETDVAKIIGLGYEPHSTDAADRDTPTNWYATSNATTGKFQLGLYPVPDTTGDTITLWFGREAQDIVAGGTCQIPDTHKFGVIHGAAEMCFRQKRLKAEAAEQRHLYKVEVKKARSHIEALLAAGIRHRDGTLTNTRGVF
jgi:hypothetical protein